MGSEQAAVRRLVLDAGGTPVPGNPVKLSAWPERASLPPAPELDQHGAAVRAELA
jgi:CoA:oxalate CoA-transferase